MGTSWYYTRAGEQQGPVELAELQRMAAAGTLHPQDLVWNETMPQWADAASITALFASPSPSSIHAPYAPPPAGAPLGYYSYTPQATSIIYAGFWLRFAAYLIDGIINMVGGFIIGAVIGFVFGMAGALNSQDGALVMQAVAQLAGIVFAWLYFALQECSSAQATLGKRAVGLRVTDLSGNRISFGRATGRYFGKYISLLTLCIGFMMAGFTQRKQALHDMMAGTLVLRNR